MEITQTIIRYFNEVETIEEYNGYFCSTGRVLTIVIIGSICGLRSVKQISDWAEHEKIKDFLADTFAIFTIPSYVQMLNVLKRINPKSLNQCFMNWTQTLIPKTLKNLTISIDGKTIRSVGKMKCHDESLHIISAHIAELGVTIGQNAVESKSNEIPAVRELIKIINISDCLIVADALNCQKETAKAIIKGGGDYLLSVKSNQKTLMNSIENHMLDISNQTHMDTACVFERNKDRLEQRTAFTTSDISWLQKREKWDSLSCVGMINRQVIRNSRVSNEWHFFISSRQLTAEELLRFARNEWSVEVVHWLLDIHYREDFCAIEDINTQQNLNIIRKLALNSIKSYKHKYCVKSALSKIMQDCLIDCTSILNVLNLYEQPVM